MLLAAQKVALVCKSRDFPGSFRFVSPPLEVVNIHKCYRTGTENWYAVLHVVGPRRVGP